MNSFFSSVAPCLYPLSLLSTDISRSMVSLCFLASQTLLDICVVTSYAILLADHHIEYGIGAAPSIYTTFLAAVTFASSRYTCIVSTLCEYMYYTVCLSVTSQHVYFEFPAVLHTLVAQLDFMYTLLLQTISRIDESYLTSIPTNYPTTSVQCVHLADLKALEILESAITGSPLSFSSVDTRQLDCQSVIHASHLIRYRVANLRCVSIIDYTVAFSHPTLLVELMKELTCATSTHNYTLDSSSSFHHSAIALNLPCNFNFHHGPLNMKHTPTTTYLNGHSEVHNTHVMNPSPLQRDFNLPICQFSPLVAVISITTFMYDFALFVLSSTMLGVSQFLRLVQSTPPVHFVIISNIPSSASFETNELVSPQQSIATPLDHIMI